MVAQYAVNKCQVKEFLYDFDLQRQQYDHQLTSGIDNLIVEGGGNEITHFPDDVLIDLTGSFPRLKILRESDILAKVV